MSSILPMDTQGGMVQRQATQADAARPDFQYWHEVFDQAHGNTPDPMRSGHFDLPPSALDEGPSSGHEGLTQAGQRLPAVSKQSSQVLSLESQIAARGVNVPATVVEGLASAALVVSVPVIQPEDIGRGSRANPRELGAADDAAETTQTPRSFSASDELQAEAGIRAHVMLTEVGGLRVALRAQRGLSVSQALAAAAQALSHQDNSDSHVEQVVLNGERIYQKTSEHPVATGASSTFELKC